MAYSITTNKTFFTSNECSMLFAEFLIKSTIYITSRLIYITRIGNAPGVGPPLVNANSRLSTVKPGVLALRES